VHFLYSRILIKLIDSKSNYNWSFSFAMKKPKKEEPFTVLVPDGESPLTLSVVRCLGQIKNIGVIVLSSNASSAVKYSRYCSLFISYSDTHEQVRLGTILKYVKMHRPEIVLPIDIKTIRLISCNKAEFESYSALSPLPNVDIFDTSNDKWLLSLWLKANQIAHPLTVKYEESKVSGFSFPMILKPARGSGGVGIHVVDSPMELKNYFEKIEAPDDLIIQSYVKGFDIDCSVLCANGEIIAHTIQKGFLFEPYRIAWPEGVEFLENEELMMIVRDLVRKLKWSGVMHIDMRFDEVEQNFKVIEINPRFWLSVSASLFAGINFPYLACLVGLNIEIPDILFVPARVVRSKTAVKMVLKKITGRQNNGVYFDNSYLELIVKDPLPNISRLVKKIVSKIKR